jgi:predicted esterase
VRALAIDTTTHGRVLVEDASDSASSGLLVGFHGYGQRAEHILDELRQIPGTAGWTLVAVQALHRFYTRDERAVVASWMTREDRELAIEDNVEYVGRAIERVKRGTDPLVIFLGFSQGASMAYRAAVIGGHPAAGVVAIGGDIPPELKAPGAAGRTWPHALLATGVDDPWFTPDRLAADAAFLHDRGVPHETCLFEGGHEWTAELRGVVGTWLEARRP